MNRRQFIKSALKSSLLLGAPIHSLSARPRQTDQPNILLIMADDFGYEVPGFNGGTSYQTPNLDKLAETGMRFEHCYSTPVCSPSRVKIMTGRYGFRTTDKWGYLPPDEITFGNVLQHAGYQTALAGKWQMIKLEDDPGHVSRHGFDEYCCWAWHEGPRYWKPRIWQNERLLQGVKDEYGPHIYTEFLIDFIRRNQHRPFLAYYAMTLTHFPKRGEPKGPDGKWETFAQMVANADEMVGKIVAVLDQLGLRENTLILFTGDNGSPTNVTSKMGDRTVKGGKKSLKDTGTHVPLLANMPGTVPGGSINTDLIDFSDFMSTFADVAKTTVPGDRAMDGQSFWPQLQGNKGKPRKWAFNYWGEQDQGWIRTHRWKLYLNSNLYDMKNDPDEKHPILPEEDTQESGAIRDRLQTALIRIMMRQ